MWLLFLLDMIEGCGSMQDEAGHGGGINLSAAFSGD